MIFKHINLYIQSKVNCIVLIKYNLLEFVFIMQISNFLKVIIIHYIISFISLTPIAFAPYMNPFQLI